MYPSILVNLRQRLPSILPVLAHVSLVFISFWYLLTLSRHGFLIVTLSSGITKGEVVHLGLNKL